MSAQKEYFALYSSNCKRCAYLDPSEKTKFSKCHYKKGNNPNCPAKEVQFVIVGKANRLAAQVRVARDNRDAATEARILTMVSKESEAFRERFYFAIENPPENL